MLKRKSRSGKVLTVLVLLFVIVGLCGSAVSADEPNVETKLPEAKLQAFDASALELPGASSLGTAETDLKTFDGVDSDKKSGIAVERPIVTNAVYEVDGSLMNFTDSLQVDDPDDFWFFSVNTDRSMVLKLLSGNSDYLAQLYIVDWSTGQAYPTSVGAYAQTQIALKNLPAGDYVFRVYSEGSVGDNYTLRMNAANPADYSSLLSISDSLKYVVASYANGNIYSSGVLVGNTQSYNSHLDWTREFYFSWGSGYNSRTHKISNVKIASVSAPVSYTSAYASSNNAILIYLNEGTSFMHHAAYYQSGPDHIYESTFDDTLGKRTPRYLDEEDIEGYGPHILVYDLNTQKAIDFYSVLNYYYAAGIEAAPTVRALN
ncbi:hypothetical protein EHV15_04305 [Paenibacillus oralis]|uniref:Peptidase C-terminal archaeal/bacterial domain-containing protein n=1 Tax=Paenibacillus oralis TaxID=2490856 RepID=A0A3P3TVT7_9BACL|nr:hypothetical protein [Paenibacillus oralis]RRJ62257.1 hypothetical protein EHV15_04305 [Paenibacillus oralis]